MIGHPNLKLWLPMNTTDTTVNDLSGNSSNGSLVSTGQPYQLVTGTIGQAVQFNGTATTKDSHITIPNSTSLNPAYITLSALVKVIGLNNNEQRVIISKAYTSHNTPYYQYYLFAFRSASGVISAYFAAAVNGTLRYTTITPVSNWYSLNQYVHIAGTYDGSYLRIYVNGVLKDSLAASGTINSYDTELIIGTHRNISVDSFNGLIDDIQIYNTALSISDIKRLAVGLHPLNRG